MERNQSSSGQRPKSNMLSSRSHKNQVSKHSENQQHSLRHKSFNINLDLLSPEPKEKKNYFASSSFKYSSKKNKFINTEFLENIDFKPKANLLNEEQILLRNQSNYDNFIERKSPNKIIKLLRASTGYSNFTQKFGSQGQKGHQKSIKQLIANKEFQQIQEDRNISNLERNGHFGLLQNSSHTEKLFNISDTEPQNEFSGVKKENSMKHSLSSRSLVSDTGEKEYIVSVIEYLSNEVGMAIYNTITGQIKLCQIVERLTYTKTISTLNKFYPQSIIYSISQESTVLIKKLEGIFRNTQFEPINRNFFDETQGFKIYSAKIDKEDTSTNPDSKFVAFAALNALIFTVQRKFQFNFKYSILPIEWLYPEQTLIIDLQTLIDLEVFFNAKTKKKQQSFIDEFKCFTKGGTRMLRANILQPLCKQAEIKQRQDLVQILMKNNNLYGLLKEELQNLKDFETINIKFIHHYSTKNNKVLKTYISSIVGLYITVNKLIILYHKLTNLDSADSGNNIFKQMMRKLQDPKISQIKEFLQTVFNTEKLVRHETLKSHKAIIENLLYMVNLTPQPIILLNTYRQNYSKSVEDIHKLFESDKHRCGFLIQLSYHQKRGYSYSCRNISQNVIVKAFGEKIFQIYRFKNTLTFSTKALTSLNENIKELEDLILEYSMIAISETVEYIQQRINILFEINYQLSTIDMVMAFTTYALKHAKTPFCRPSFSQTFGVIKYKQLKPVWFKQVNYEEDNQLLITEAQNMLFYERQYNNEADLVNLISLGFMVILAQIGSLVPATFFQTTLFRFFTSKFNIKQTIQTKLSHFQTEVSILNSIVTTLDDTSLGTTLILIDEVVKGTNQLEELAIGLGFIQRIEFLNGFVVGISSDEAFLKYLAESYPIVRVVVLKEKYNKSTNQQFENSIEQLLQKFQFPDFIISHIKDYKLHKDFVSIASKQQKQDKEYIYHKNLAHNLNIFIELSTLPELQKEESEVYEKLCSLFEQIL